MREMEVNYYGAFPMLPAKVWNCFLASALIMALGNPVDGEEFCDPFSNCYVQRDLELRFEPDGEVFLHNPHEFEVLMDGYTLSSVLDDINVADWNPLQQQAVDDRDGLAALLGRGALEFGVANPNPSHATELTLGEGAKFPPGYSHSIGHPLPGSEAEILERGANYFFNSSSFVIGRPAPIGDATLDGIVDDADFEILRENFGLREMPPYFFFGGMWKYGDFNEDRIVNLWDFSLLKSHFGTDFNQVPEPGTWSLMILGAALAALTRRQARRVPES